MMRSTGINKKIVSIFEKMYDKTTCAVVVDGLLIEWFSVSVVVRQGCLLSPTLFKKKKKTLWPLFMDGVQLSPG